MAKLSDNTDLSCQVRIEQAENGEILIRCLFGPGKGQVTALSRVMLLSDELQIESLSGQVDDGLSFETRGKLFISRWNVKSTGYRTIILVIQEVALWRETDTKNNSLCRFDLVNFEFIGNQATKKLLNKGNHTTEQYYLCLKLNLPWGEVEVHPVADYGKIIRRIKAQNGIAVTGEVVVRGLPRREFSDIIEKVDELCRLLSLARGTKVNWISAESVTADGNITYIILKQSVTWPFSSLTLIDYRNADDTPLFVERTYPAYLRCRDSYNLDIAIEQYLDAKRQTAYLETRGLAAVALIDSLQQLYASTHGLTEIVRGFGKQNSRVRECLKNFLISTFPQIKSEELHEVLEKTPELNRKSFLNLLKTWTQGLGLQIPDSELAAVRDTRHSLAHRMCFKSSDHREKLREYFRLINLLSQVFLKLLDYTGYFIHVNLDTLAFERKELV